MPEAQPITHGTVAADPVSAPPTPPYYEPVQDDAWSEDVQEPPRRPRRRLLAPAPLALMAALLIAAGFIGGVLVEKGQTSTASTPAASGAGLASRFAALRGAASGGAGGAAGGGAGAPASASGSSAGAATAGQVSFVEGSTLYVLDAQGNTVKVKTSRASGVTKTVSSSVKGIHPGETVLVTGTTGADGSVSAESIRVGGSEGGLRSLLGGAGKGSAGSSGAAGGGPALFGSGG